MLCTKCGNLNADGSKFCQYCGSALTETEQPVEQQNQQPAEQQYQQPYNPGYQYQQYQQYQPYTAPQQLPNVLVWGILSLVFNFIGLSLLSIVFGIVGLNNAKQYKRIAGAFDSSASAGHALSIVGIVLGAIITIAVFAIFVFAFIIGIEMGFDDSFIEYYSVIAHAFH